jgi:hypothetical protein
MCLENSIQNLQIYIIKRIFLETVFFKRSAILFQSLLN